MTKKIKTKTHKTTSTTKKSGAGNKGGLALAGGAAGAMMGAAIGAATAVALTNVDTRKKLKSAFVGIRDEAIDTAGKIQIEADTVQTKKTSKR